jgi:serine/threonine protein phosphatase PrpC
LRLANVEHAKLYFEQGMTEGETYAIAKGTVGVFSQRCPYKDTPNEDAAALIPYDAETALLVVADGLGGVPAGEQAARIAVKSMESAVRKVSRDGTPLRDSVIDGIADAIRKIQELGTGDRTTLAVVETPTSVTR